MNNWPYRQLSDFLVEREGRFKPNDPEIAGYKRLDKIDFSGQIHISENPSKTDMIIIEPGDLVISGINVAKGALAVYEGEKAVTATIHYSSYRFNKNKIDIAFLKRFLKSPAFISELQEQVKGGIKTEIKPKHLLPLKARIPELDEQQKVNHHFDAIENEISDLSNEVNAQSSYLTKLRQAILQEAIEGKLTADLPCRQAGWRNNKFRNFSNKIVPNNSDKYFAYVLECEDGSLYKGFSKDLFSRIDRHLEGRGAEWTQKHKPVSLIHFEEFNTEKEAIEREKYFKSGSGREWLNEIREQSKFDYDAEALLKKIQAEKQRMFTKGLIKQEKPLLLIDHKDMPFVLPEGWAWSRLGEILKNPPRNGYSPREVNYETKVKSLKLGATTWGVFNPLEHKFIDEDIPVDSVFWLKPNDILIQRSNSIDYVGVTAIYTGKENEFIYPDLMMKLEIINPISVVYSHKVLSAPFCREYFRNNAKGAQKSMPKINQGIVNNTIIPIPPLAEQQAIVERVEKLLSMVDELEKQVSARKEQSEQLMQAVLREAFEGENHG